jgi:hypothetical protein
MLYMTIYTYEPDKRNDVIRRAVEKGRMTPEGMKEVGVWSAMGGGRVFRVIEADDPAVMYESSYAWSDLGKIEIIPIMDNDELLKMLASKK